jgi:uncharacterized cupredoxin-like copper-binding protein
MRTIRTLFAFVFVLGLVILTACGTTEASTTPRVSGGADAAITAGPGVQQVTVTVGNRMSFDPSTIDVRAGDPVRLTLQNNGTILHDFTLTDGAAEPVKITAPAGQAAAASFTITAPGTYAFECSVPGHASAGMQGTITAR